MAFPPPFFLPSRRQGATTITCSSAGGTLDGLIIRNRGGDYALDIQVL